MISSEKFLIMLCCVALFSATTPTAIHNIIAMLENAEEKEMLMMIMRFGRKRGGKPDDDADVELMLLCYMLLYCRLAKQFDELML